MPGRTVSRVWPYDPTLAAPAKYRRACRYDAFIPDLLADLRVSLPADVAGLASEAQDAIHALNARAQPALAPLARLLLRTESIASSRIEGMHAGLSELARAEARLEGGGRAGTEAREILANVDAMELAVAVASRAAAVTTSGIAAIHRRLMQRAINAKRIAGKVRTVQNWIGGNDYNPCGADFVPPPPDDVPRLLADLCDALGDDRLPPLVQAALVHAQFETIHPFADGNGRTGRALIHVVLRRRGVAPAYVPPVSVALARDRARYIDGLTSFRGDDVVPWIEQFSAAAHRAATLASAYLAQVAALTEQWRIALERTHGALRADAAARRVIDVLPAHPVVSAPAAAASTGRSRPQVYAALEQLEQAGVLLPLSTGRRNRLWEAAKLLPLLERFGAGEAPGSQRRR